MRRFNETRGMRTGRPRSGPYRGGRLQAGGMLGARCGCNRSGTALVVR